MKTQNLFSFRAISAFAFTISTLIAQTSFAATQQQILEMTSDVQSGVSRLTANINDSGALDSVRFQMIPTNGDAKKVDTTFTIAQLKKGVVLLNMAKGPFSRDVVSIQFRKLDPLSGGQGTAILLREFGFVSDDYRLLPLELKKDGDHWQAVVNDVSGRKNVDSAFIKGLQGATGAVGIESITFYQDKAQVGTINTENLQEQ